jgi:hypothetical protein
MRKYDMVTLQTPRLHRPAPARTQTRPCGGSLSGVTKVIKRPLQDLAYQGLAQNAVLARFYAVNCLPFCFASVLAGLECLVPHVPRRIEINLLCLCTGVSLVACDLKLKLPALLRLVLQPTLN